MMKTETLHLQKSKECEVPQRLHSGPNVTVTHVIIENELIVDLEAEIMDNCAADNHIVKIVFPSKIKRKKSCLILFAQVYTASLFPKLEVRCFQK